MTPFKSITKTILRRNDKILNAMTVDVEDYFQVAAFENQMPLSSWDTMESRVVRNSERVLGMFDEAGVKGTFFVLGWVAERFPEIVHRIVAEGHELACHGLEHRRVNTQNQEEFRADIKRAKAILEDISGVAIKGYRASTFSIGHKNLWAFDILSEEGFTYSSSVNPIAHDLYGMPDAPRFAFQANDSGLMEYPITTVRFSERNFPCGGGGFFRLLPYPIFKRAFSTVNTRDHEAGIFYFHPWEVDPKQPRIPGAPLKSKIRHYLNLKKMEPRLTKLLKDFEWDRMDRVFSSQLTGTHMENGN